MLVAGAALVGGCKVGASDADGGSGFLPDIDRDDFDRAKREVEAALRRLFPELSDEEIADITGSVSLSDVLAIEAELEAVRDSVAEFSEDLFKSAEERVEERDMELADHNDGYPEGLEAIGSVCVYDQAEGHAQIQLSGVFNGMQAVTLSAEQVSVRVDGQDQEVRLSCLPNGPSVDIVFLIDITGSMSNVIDSVRDSVVDFIDIIESSGLSGTVSVVSFQDTVGVNRTFQERAPASDYERSPFFAPVDMGDAGGIAELRSFVNRLEANRGADAPENLAAAVDFARNSVIGENSRGEPNVIGEGSDDPAGTEPFPALTSERQVFVVLTDITFHSDGRSSDNSSLEAAFEPRDAADILASLQQTGTVVHVSDPSWSDAELDPGTSGPSVDADYWAIHTGGLGEDRVLGYSLVDLELVVVAEGTGLLDITLDEILATSCRLDFDAELQASSEVSVTLELDAETTFSTELSVNLL